MDRHGRQAPAGCLGGVLVRDRAQQRRIGLRVAAAVGAQAACLAAFVGYRIAAAVSTAPGVWQDSEDYHKVAAHGWLTAGLWAGARAPGVPVLMKITGGYDSYVLAEGVLGALAWAFVAYTASRLVPASWRKPAVTALVLGFAASPLVVMWDGSALSESPSLSMLALLWAGSIWLVRRFSWTRLACFGVVALVYCELRDADIWTLGLIGLAGVVIGAVRAFEGVAVDPRGTGTRLRENWNRARRPATVGSVLLVVALATGMAAASSHRNIANVEGVFGVRVFPFPDRVAWFASNGMPEAQAIDALAASTRGVDGQAPVVGPDLATPQWRPLRLWFEHDGLASYAQFLVLHPGYVLSAPFATPRLTFNDAHGDIAAYDVKWYPMASWLGPLYAPNRFVELSLGALAVALAAWRGVWRARAWRLTVLFGVLGLWSMLLSWHGEGQEVTRHMVEGDVAVRLAVLLALVFAVLMTPPRRAVAGTRTSAAAPEQGGARATEAPPGTPGPGRVPQPVATGAGSSA